MPEIRPCLLGCTNSDGIPYPAAPGWLACHPCADLLAGVLGDLADRYATLQDADALIPTSTGERGSPGYGPRSPAVDALLIHSDIRTRWTSEHGYGALAVVADWARRIREDTSIDTPPRQMRNTVPEGRVTMSRELATIRFHWDWLMRQDWLAVFADNMRDVLRGLTNAGRLTERWLRVGPCPGLVDIGEEVFTGEPIYRECGEPLRVRASDAEIRCRTCGTTWPRSQWSRLGDTWTDYAELHERLKVPVATLRWWCREDGWRTWRKTETSKRVLVDRADALTSYARRRAGKVA
jgi:hypothetical protein